MVVHAVKDKPIDFCDGVRVPRDGLERDHEGQRRSCLLNVGMVLEAAQHQPRIELIGANIVLLQYPHAQGDAHADHGEVPNLRIEIGAAIGSQLHNAAFGAAVDEVLKAAAIGIPPGQRFGVARLRPIADDLERITWR